MVFAFMLFLTACGEKIETNMSRDVQAFEFTTQDNESLALKDLEGKWWVADFIFTNCTTVCLPMTTNMSKLQDKIKQENLDVQLVSFSVDPEYDTPKVLEEYAESYQADLSNWSFLTGYEFQTIKELSIKSFQSPLEKPPEGEVIKRYSGTDPKKLDVIIDDLKEVS
ncbi:cytochrome c oxidase assembly protein [Virgibacillus profundi]|uniref:Cytochrome c oxidase assembly protein n=2 Tax=Virgibacillus profundi TaxID=2024555 RepID=A0A2A2ICB2_9BACI|nr:cytochrome c oxidase assembly protein [Virgibacillus profundi]PXY52938.1 SCO family protein [Virgibacillus profundi]